MITAIVTPDVSVLLLQLFFGGGLERDLVWFIVIAVLSGLVSTVLHYNAINAVLNKQQ